MFSVMGRCKGMQRKIWAIELYRLMKMLSAILVGERGRMTSWVISFVQSVLKRIWENLNLVIDADIMNVFVGSFGNG